MSYRELALNVCFDKARQTHDPFSSFKDQVCIIPPQLDLPLSRCDSRFRLPSKILDDFQNDRYRFQILVPGGGVPENSHQQWVITGETMNRPVDEILQVQSVRVWVSHALLKNREIFRKTQTPKWKVEDSRKTHVNKNLKLRVFRHLVIDTILRNWKILDILQIRIPGVQERITHRGSDTANDRMLLYLYLEQLVEESLVVHVQFTEVMKYILDECLQPFAREDRRVHRT